ncbi:MAG: L-serine ammonia-lyase [Desulfomicrobium sp.]
MESIREIYRIGSGPSSSHTMGPKLAAERFRARAHGAVAYQVVLYESLAATGKGHLTDKAIREALAPFPVEIVWAQDRQRPEHPNAMDFTALDENGQVLDSWTVFSVGGGALRDRGSTFATPHVYPLQSLTEIMELCAEEGITYWEFVSRHENEDIWLFLEGIWTAMQDCMERGLNTEGVLPGGLGLARKASSYHQKTLLGGPEMRRTGLLAAYALAVSEENASGGTVVTAPTCGASGVLPSVLRYLQETMTLRARSILQALATAGLIGVIIKHNASISGAEVGCQGEVGSACAMAAAAAAQLMGGTIRQIEYAAEMGLEHHLGLTCDPVGGLVQIPCIERNAMAASKAVGIAHMALLSDGSHRIPFDEVVRVMKETGHDLPSLYRETSHGGLAKAYGERKEKRGSA